MGEWSNGLCGCFNNFGLCAITYLFPCVTAGKNAEAVGESCFLYGCLSTLGPVGVWSRAKIRSKIRESKGIEGGMGMDCVMHMFCVLCALVQEGQEVEGAAPQAMARE